MHYLQSITVSLVYRTRSNQKRDKNNKTDEHEHEGDTVRLNSFLRRCWKLGYSNRRIMFEDMCAEADEQLFDRLINETNHVLHRLLPSPTTASQHYNLRSRMHTLQLPEHSTRLSDSNFLVRMLYWP